MYPVVYHSPVVYMALQLAEKFQLAFHEVAHELLLLLAMGTTLPKSIYLWLLPLSLLDGPFSNGQHRRGYYFGYMFVNVMNVVKVALAMQESLFGVIRSLLYTGS